MKVLDMHRGDPALASVDVVQNAESASGFHQHRQEHASEVQPAGHRLELGAAIIAGDLAQSWFG